MRRPYDLAVVGAGILGLAHALAAARRGKRCVVIERDLQSRGASIRNFGFITVTGQERGACWERARRSREIWSEIAAPAGIPIVQRGLLVLARRPETMGVLEAFAADPMGDRCTLLTPGDLSRHETIRAEEMVGALHSPHELRVESREAIPRLSRWLSEAHGVDFLYGTTVHEIAPPRLKTSAGTIEADAIVVCPGDDFRSLYAGQIAELGLTRCKLQMLRLAPGSARPDGPAIMSDLGVHRYHGYHHLAGHEALGARLASDQPGHLRAGVHLIAVTSADGSQVVGDSHVYGDDPDPFSDDAIDRLILEEHEATHRETPSVIARWTGTYASGPQTMIRREVAPGVHLVIVTSGTGASTSFAIAEETLDEIWGGAP